MQGGGKAPIPPHPCSHPSAHRACAGRQAGAKAHTLEAMIKREDSGFRVASVLAT